MNKVIFTSRKKFMNMPPDKDTVVISIISSFLDRDNIEPPVLDGWHPDSIQLLFDDICPGELIGEGCAREALMNNLHAELIIEILDKHTNKVNWVVHCEAGISRSAAVARFIGETTDLPIIGEGGAHDTANSTPHVSALLDRVRWSEHFNEEK